VRSPEGRSPRSRQGSDLVRNTPAVVSFHQETCLELSCLRIAYLRIFTHGVQPKNPRFSIAASNSGPLCSAGKWLFKRTHKAPRMAAPISAARREFGGLPARIRRGRGLMLLLFESRSCSSQKSNRADFSSTGTTIPCSFPAAPARMPRRGGKVLHR